MQDTSLRTNITDYRDILNKHELEYIPFEHYWLVGQIKSTQGWILHLSVILLQLEELFSILLPFLIENSIPFKIPKNKQIAEQILEGSMGYDQLAKLVCIYPEGNEKAIEIAHWLINSCGQFRGPDIPTDRCLGGILFTRYGSFNPIWKNDHMGRPAKFIYTKAGNLIQDLYTIPFVLPDGITWPFSEFVTPIHSGKRKLLNYSYYPQIVIKADAKGNVIRGLYFKYFWKIKHCLIKQGRRNMFCDNEGRDIQERLKWQFKLYQELSGHIPMPEIFDIFEENGDTYLAMEFINGISLKQWIDLVYQNTIWINLSQDQQHVLLDKLIEILEIVRHLHKLNFIHRDISPENFLIDKKGKISLIDMELAWSLKEEYPSPPFMLGTPGHMSPEQWVASKPTPAEDIYGIGGMMVTFFTNLYAMKFEGQSVRALENSIQFFTDNAEISSLISRCCEPTPSKRPELNDIIDHIKKIRNEISDQDVKDALMHRPPQSVSGIEKIIQSGLNGLSQPIFLNPKYRWVSLVKNSESIIGNERKEMSLYEGWHTGMAGPLWLLAKAKQSGFSTDFCDVPYMKSWEYIQENYFPYKERQSPGLYTGNAGIAVALIEGLNSGLVLPEERHLQQIHDCFSHQPTTLDLANGIAGQGVALLSDTKWVQPEIREILLNGYIDTLISQQNKNGSWLLPTSPTKKNDIYTSLDLGVGGIILFLLNYLKKYENSQVAAAVQKGLLWFEQTALKRKEVYAWNVSTGSLIQSPLSISFGTPGVALLFIKAYNLFRIKKYAIIAENSLSNLPENIVNTDLSFTTGLSGLGEVYLQGREYIGTRFWNDRSNWIANLITNLFIKNENQMGKWTPNISLTTSADLFTENSGILHFLLHYLSSNNSQHLF